MPTDAGMRDRLITLQQRSPGADTSGFPVESWSTLAANVFAMKRHDRTDGERYQSDQLTARAIIRWEIPYRADMDPDLVNVTRDRRVDYQNRAWDITAAVELGRREGIELTTMAKVDA